jgi:hypothetical protein
VRVASRSTSGSRCAPGYSGDVDLAGEAIRLTRQLAAKTNHEEVAGLPALMLLHHARRPARTGPDGRLVPLAEQDRSLWNTRLIAEGVDVLQTALAGDRLGEFQAQAAIAALHADAEDLTAQRDRPSELGVPEQRIYLDHGLTGTNRNRPGVDQALAAVRAGDTLVVPKLDRLARSVPDARAIGDDLAARGVKLSLGGQVYDPADPMGKMFFNSSATPVAGDPGVGEPVAGPGSPAQPGAAFLDGGAVRGWASSQIALPARWVTGVITPVRPEGSLRAGQDSVAPLSRGPGPEVKTGARSRGRSGSVSARSSSPARSLVDPLTGTSWPPRMTRLIHASSPRARSPIVHPSAGEPASTR